MSRIVKLAAAAIAIALTAAIVGAVAYDRGRAAPRESSVRYHVSLKSPAPVVAANVRDLTAQAQSPGYRVRLAPNTVVEVSPRPSCHYVTWRAVTTRNAR